MCSKLFNFIFDEIHLMKALELKVYEILKNRFSEEEAEIFIEYFEEKSSEKIEDKKDVFLTKQDKVELIEKMNSDKVALLGKMNADKIELLGKMNKDKIALIKWMFGFWITIILFLFANWFFK